MQSVKRHRKRYWIAELIHQGFDSKKRSDKKVSNLHIEETYDATIDSGALAGKVSGGRVMIFFVPPDKRMDVSRTLGKLEGQARGQKGDVFIGYSASDKSANVLLAFEEACYRGHVCIGLTDSRGGSMRELCDHLLEVPSG